MRAICTHRLVNNFPFLIIEEGEVVEYTVKDRKFIISEGAMSSAAFFNHFKVIDGKDRMSYSDFHYIICNYVFTMALLHGEDLNNGNYFLIIDDWDNKCIFVHSIEKENAIYVSFNHSVWRKYASYEEALDGIRNHQW